MSSEELRNMFQEGIDRLEEGDNSIDVFEWVMGELSTFARSSKSEDLTKAVFTLNIARTLYRNQFNDILSQQVEKQIDENDFLNTADQRELVFILNNRSLSELFDDNELQINQFNNLLRDIISSEDLRISNEQYQSLPLKIAEVVETAFVEAQNDIIHNDNYGMANALRGLKSSVEEDSALLDRCLDLTYELHKEQTGWP